jgi:hypothetical protein
VVKINSHATVTGTRSDAIGPHISTEFNLKDVNIELEVVAEVAMTKDVNKSLTDNKLPVMALLALYRYTLVSDNEAIKRGG